jgi:N-acetylmuramoyl-L-alanine amidase
MTMLGTFRGRRQADLDATKLRLVREVIQDNIRGGLPGGRKVEAAPRFILPMLMTTAFMIASLVYLSVPSAVDPRVGVAAASPSRASAAEPSVGSAGAGMREGDVLSAAPRRLSRSVLPLSVRKIVLDAGHGGAQAGAISDSGVSEKEITLDIAFRLRRLLEDAQFEVLMTREADATLSLERRVAFANDSRADLFVSIHVNWIPRPQIRPLETYFAGPTDDPAALRLASVENRDAGYSLAAYRQLLEKVYIDARRDESHALARSLNAALYRSLSEANPELENRGVKTAPFAVLVGTQMPAVLVEVSCLSNEADVRLLTMADYRDRIAMALLRGIRAYASDLDGVGKKES